MPIHKGPCVTIQEAKLLPYRSIAQGHNYLEVVPQDSQIRGHEQIPNPRNHKLFGTDAVTVNVLPPEFSEIENRRSRLL